LLVPSLTLFLRPLTQRQSVGHSQTSNAYHLFSLTHFSLSDLLV